MDEESILDTIKIALGVGPDDTAFDTEIMLHLNSAFSTLRQIGAAPELGFYIKDKEATWLDFYGPANPLQEIKTYLVLRVKLLFDPPTTGYYMEAVKEQIKELEWRLNSEQWVFNPSVYIREEVIPNDE